MRIENVSSFAPGSKAAGQPSAGQPLSGAKIGDSFTARVLFSEGGNVHIKTEGGSVVKARLEGGVSLEVGAEVELVVTDLEGGVITLALAEGGKGRYLVPDAPPLGDIAAMEADRALAPLVNQLKALNLPVTRQIVEAMGNLLSRFPDMPLKDAAFLAASGALENPANLLPAVNLLYGEGKAGDMLQTLMALVPGFEAAPDPPLSAELPLPAGPALPEEPASAARKCKCTYRRQTDENSRFNAKIQRK